MYKIKIFFLLLFLSLSFYSFAQNTKKEYYIYNIVTFEGKFDKEGIKVNIDNGNTIEKLLDANGYKIKFRTPAAALMYFVSKGWELYVNGSVSEGAVYNGLGGTSTQSYWIIRKPCSKEEFDNVINNCIKK